METVNHVGQDEALLDKFEKLQKENRELKAVMEDLQNLVVVLSNDVNKLEGRV